ncbi:ciliogenesis-associated TTC17-interacting protein-like [Bolinopsis microptera]|uniref:ciliogenesis-associated TTC17-interacting protein-like n=1 Tax=Bolinopsis microptera TaxID=2820187 RepID=UPI00307A11BA
MSQLDRTGYYSDSPVSFTKVLAPPGGGNSEENNTSQSLRVLAPPGGRVSLDLFGGYGQDVARPARKVREVVVVKSEDRVVDTPKRKTRNILIPGNPLTKRSVLSQTDDGYQLVLTTTEGGTETVTTEEFTKDEMARFISEGANLVLQRLSIILGVHSRMSFNVFSTDNALANVSYSPIESHSVLLQNVTLETIGIERCVDNKDENPTTWKIYFLSDGHMYTRAQVGSPVYMKIKDIPENFMKDEDADWVFPDFGKGKLHWEDDIEMLSHFLDRKEELKEDHVNYMKRHPELKAILGDFLQFLLMRKPSDVIEFAADFFSSYSATAEMKPSFAHSNFVNQSAIRSE